MGLGASWRFRLVGWTFLLTPRAAIPSASRLCTQKLATRCRIPLLRRLIYGLSAKQETYCMTLFHDTTWIGFAVLLVMIVSVIFIAFRAS
jgi:hypothetical protein